MKFWLNQILVLILVAFIYSCESENRIYEKTILDKVIEEERIDKNQKLDRLRYLFYNDTGKVGAFYYKALEIDSTFEILTNRIDSLQINFDSKPRKYIKEQVTDIENLAVNVLENANKEFFFSEMYKRAVPILNYSLKKYNIVSLSAIKLAILQSEQFILNEFYSEVFTIDCWSNMRRDIWVLDNIDPDSNLIGEYNGFITIAEVPVYLKKYHFTIDSIFLNHELRELNHSIDTIEGKFRLKIDSKSPGNYKWYGRYCFMKPNGRWDTTNLERSFVVK